MKYLIGLLLLVSSCTPANHIYIVRHAEKATNDPTNPDLTAAGIAKANALAALLQSKGIRKIYSTNFKRTIGTATPLSEQINVPVEFYKNDTSGRMLNRLIHLKVNALVVGHSNTSISMLDSLQVTHIKKQIPDNEYDNLFDVVVKKGKAVKVKEEKFGAGK